MSQSPNDSNEPQEDIIDLIDPISSNSNNGHVEMASTLTKLEESLECPVCYRIPRDVPISCCERGHIVCEPCRGRVATCPTCRGRLDSNITSSLAATQIMLVDHKCKFAFYGCDVKMKLEQIVVHEETCPERTVICPKVTCKEEVQLRKFNEHATKSKCSVPKLAGSDRCTSRLLKLIVAPPGSELNPNENLSFDMISFQDHDLTFYFLSFYLASKNFSSLFIFSVMLPDDMETASKYNARITVGRSQRKLTFEGSVLSIEDLPKFEDKKAKMKYWFVAHDALESFSVREPDRVGVPILVEVQKIGNKRKRT